ncbi:MAG: hypothetical protein AAF466_11780, partial [Bacteroidota bacterium]
NLKRGQSTFFDTTIHGVGTIEAPLVYTVANGTPSIVTLEGGNSQTFTIQPGDGESGNWFRHFNIKSLRTGNFSLTTNLVVPEADFPVGSDVGGNIVDTDNSNINCRIFDQSFQVTATECEALGGTANDGSVVFSSESIDAGPSMSELEVTLTGDSNEVGMSISIIGGELPEMIVSTCTPIDPELESAVSFLTESQSSYQISAINPSFGRPSAANLQTTLLYSDGSAQVVNHQINFKGNPFFSIAQSAELDEIRKEQRDIVREINSAKTTKDQLEGQQKTARDRYIKARETYRINNSQFWYLWKIDQSLEKAQPAFADSLKVLTDSLKTFKKRTGGAPGRADAKKIEDNLRDARKAHQDCLAQLAALKQEQTDHTNEIATLKEQQKQLHREIMALFRTTGMDFAGSTRRDKDGNFHYQYGVVTVSGDGTGTFHKGSLPVQIAGKVAALEKQMKLVTERLNALNERSKALPGEIAAKSAACGVLAQKVEDAEAAKSRKDALTAEEQYWNNKIEAMCAKITTLLTRLKKWAALNDPSLLSLIEQVRCGDDIWVKINSVIKRKQNLEKGYEGKATNARRDMNNAKKTLEELEGKIKAQEEKIKAAQKALVANQKEEAKAAAAALSKDKEKCLKIMKELGYEATTIADVIDLYEISQDLKKAADEAKNAMDNLRKAIDYGAKQGLDPGAAKKWVAETQKRLGAIAKKLEKLEKYRDLAKKIQEYADRIGKLIGSDGTPTKNAEAFGEGLKFMNEALQALAQRFPILKVFTAYFTFITESYGAIMNGANDALKKEYQQLLANVRNNMSCEQLMRVCCSDENELAKIKEWAYNEYVVKPGFDGLRRDQTQAKKIIDKLVEQRMAECCFQRLQAIKAAE